MCTPIARNELYNASGGRTRWVESGVQQMAKQRYVWLGLRFVMTFTCLWAFFDKLIGLGFSTCRDKATGVVTSLCANAWLVSGSPTQGFLSGVKGPLAWFFNPMAGHPVVNALFMMGLFTIGLALLLGMGVKIAGYSGAVFMFLLYLAAVSTYTSFTNDPLFDEHITYALVLLGLSRSNAGQRWGFGNWWSKTRLVNTYPWLQ